MKFWLWGTVDLHPYLPHGSVLYCKSTWPAPVLHILIFNINSISESPFQIPVHLFPASPASLIIQCCALPSWKDAISDRALTKVTLKLKLNLKSSCLFTLCSNFSEIIKATTPVQTAGFNFILITFRAFHSRQISLSLQIIHSLAALIDSLSIYFAQWPVNFQSYF